MKDKLFITALFISAVAHAVLIGNLTFNKSTLFKSGVNTKSSEPNLDMQELRVGFLDLTKAKSQPIGLAIEKKAPNVIKENVGASLENTNRLQPKAQIQEQSDASNEASMKTGSAGTEPTFRQYYKSNEVDISAIPFNGVESPLTANGNYLLEDYYLRVYVNKKGSVDYVVNLNQESSLQLFYSEVEKQVKNLTFIPAKKNGVEVDSYIDIALGGGV